MLGSALRNRPYADRGVAQRTENLRGDTMRTGHAVADDRQNAHAERNLDVLNLAAAQFSIEGAAHRLLRANRLSIVYCNSDSMLRAGLRNQDDGDPGVAQYSE